MKLWRIWLLMLIGGIGFAAEPPAEWRFAKPREWTTLREEKLVETGGLTPAEVLPNQVCCRAHNDGADEPRLYLINETGEAAGRADLPEVKVSDLEDLCSFTWRQQRYLLLADTGDNDLQRESVQLILFPEPTRAQATERNKMKWDIRRYTAIPAVFPAGAHNCEAVAVDPVSEQVLLVSKEKKSGCTVYALKLPEVIDFQAGNPPLRMTKIAAPEIPTILGAALTADGRRLILLGREQLFAFTREPTESWSQVLARPAIELPKPRQKQGEAICWSSDQRSLFLASEGKQQPIWVPSPE